MTTTAQHQYSFQVADLRNNNVLADLPLDSCSYSNKLSDIGSMSGSFKINPDILKLNPLEVTQPGRMSIYVIRDGIPVWGGIIWGRQYSVNDRTMTVNAETFDSYFGKRFQMQRKNWTNTDQLDMARWFMTSSQIDSTLRMDLSNKTSGVLRERNVFDFEFKTIEDEFSSLHNLLNGFDYEIEVYADANTKEIRRKLEFYYPQKGLPTYQSTLLFEFPGTIQTFNVSWDAKDAANKVWTIGAGEGTEQLTGSAIDLEDLQNEWPLLEISRAYKSVYKPSTLNAHASSILNLKNTPVTIYSVTVRPDGNPALGSYRTGDWAQFALNDPLLGRIKIWQRIIEISVSVDASGLENVTLALSSGEEPIAEDLEADIL